LDLRIIDILVKFSKRLWGFLRESLS